MQSHAANLQIPVGDSHNCVTLSDGTAQCWGNNMNGQLGNGNTIHSSIPVVVQGLSNTKMLSTGYYHTCALLGTGAVQCWGGNSYGQLGEGTIIPSLVPVMVNKNGIGNVVSLSAGGFHSCAVLGDGTVQCWGSNENGQLGNGTTTNSSIPVPVSGISDAIAVSAGTYHSCALLRTGEVQCWGSNDTGQLGNSTMGTNMLKPIAVTNITTATAVTTGRNHSCAIVDNGAVQCWGSSIFGQLGNGTTSTSTKPVAVLNVLNANTIAAGSNHTCVALSSGAVQCWGSNKYGQLGNGTVVDSFSPVTMNGVSNALSLITGYYHSCVVQGSGGVQCVGENSYGQLGNGANTDNLMVLSVIASTSTNSTELFNWQRLFQLPLQLASLGVTGSAILQSGGSIGYAAVATYSDGSSHSVPAVWQSSNPLVASVNAAGVLKAGIVTADTPITLSASWIENGVTKQTSLLVTVTATPMVLTNLQFVGVNNSVQSGAKVHLILNAVYSDGSSKVVPVSYSLSNDALGIINPIRGILTLANVTVDTPLTVTATYSEGGVTRSTSMAMNILASPSTLSRLTLIGTQMVLMAGDSLNLAAQGVYSDGSRKPVNATWQIVGSAATITSEGVLTAQSVPEDSTVIVRASYTNPVGVSVNAEYLVFVKSSISAPLAPVPIQAEVEATGLYSDFGLSFWSSLNLGSSASTRSRVSPRAATAPTSYKMFVAALVPGGSLVSSPTLFLLNRSAQWALASFPLPEYLSNVANNSTQWVELFDHLDSNIIKGTQFFVGYGITDTEMIESGRFQMVYQLQ